MAAFPLKKCSAKQISETLASSRRLQTCPSSFDREELLLNDPEFLENFIVENDEDPKSRRLVVELKTLLRRSKYYLHDDETTASVHFASAAAAAAPLQEVLVRDGGLK